jgi:hypothetical protein
MPGEDVGVAGRGGGGREGRKEGRKGERER